MPAQRNHVGYHSRRSGKQGLDAAVPAVAHPSFKFACDRLVLDPGAIADALHPPANRYLKNRAHLSPLEPEKFHEPRFHIVVAHQSARQLR